MHEYIKKTKSSIDLVLAVSFSMPEDIISLVPEDSLITVTHPDSAWHGLTGRIDTNFIKTYIPDFLDRNIYIAGPEAFVNAMQEQLHILQVQDIHIKAETFPGY